MEIVNRTVFPPSTRVHANEQNSYSEIDIVGVRAYSNFRYKTIYRGRALSANANNNNVYIDLFVKKIDYFFLSTKKDKTRLYGRAQDVFGEHVAAPVNLSAPIVSRIRVIFMDFCRNRRGVRLFCKGIRGVGKKRKTRVNTRASCVHPGRACVYVCTRK